jgi:superfamily II DNA or RNA helicase
MSHKSLTRNGYTLKKKYMKKQEIDKIKKELTVKPIVLAAFKEFQKPKPYQIFLESPQRLYVPRFWGIKKFGDPTKVKLSPGKAISFNDTIKLMPHQHTAFNRIMQQFGIIYDGVTSNIIENDVGGGGVVCLPCGFGKTILAIKTISLLKKKALVLVNKEFLMEQWVDKIEEFTDAKVGILQQNKIEVDGRDIVIGMLHSVCLKNYPPEIFNDFGFVIIDEVHHVASEMFSKSLPKVATKYMLGLSATPNRKDGLSCVFYNYLGDLFHQERRQGVNSVVVKKIVINSSSPHFENIFLANGVKNTATMITNISEFEARNNMIVVILKALIEKGRKILVLSARREHLEHLMELLEKASIRTPQNKFVTFGLYYGKTPGMNKKQYKKMLAESAKCDIVLGTHQMASEALDIPDLNTLLFATPANEVEQAVGRILRRYHKDINPLVIDIVDKFGNFVKHFSNREKLYKFEKYAVDTKTPPIYLYDDEASNTYHTVLSNICNVTITDDNSSNDNEDNESDDADIINGIKCNLDDDMEGNLNNEKNNPTTDNDTPVIENNKKKVTIIKKTLNTTDLPKKDNSPPAKINADPPKNNKVKQPKKSNIPNASKTTVPIILPKNSKDMPKAPSKINTCMLD